MFVNNSLSIVPQPLQFYLKLDKSDVGIFSHSQIFRQATNLEAGFEDFTPAQVVVTFFRPAVLKIFPFFIIVAFWLVIIFQVYFYVPFLLYSAKLTVAPTVSVSVGLLFALPGLNHQIKPL
jgi:hypothetical protein